MYRAASACVVKCYVTRSGVIREGLGGFKAPPPSPKFRNFDEAEPNSQLRGKYIRNNLIRIWVSLNCKLSGTSDQGATAPQIPVLSALCPQQNLLSPFARTKFLDTPLVTRKNATVGLFLLGNQKLSISTWGVMEFFIL
jgi:hypothetical protein